MPPFMPGITGVAASEAAGRLVTMERELYPAPGLRRQSISSSADFACVDFSCAVWARRDTAGIAERGGACLAFDGYVTNLPLRGADLPEALLDGFLAQGPGFLEKLDGSFQIVVHREGTTWLFADPTGSRRFFYVSSGQAFTFSPEVAPLVGFQSGGIDPANLVQFLVSGRFFAGRTLLSDVRQLLPGESVSWRAGRLERRRHFRYEVAPLPQGPPDAAAALRDVLERSVLQAWEQAPFPFLSLSGGYDSRTILHLLTRKLGNACGLRTALWGQRMDVPGCDNRAAEEVARRAGLRHLVLPWRTEVLPEQLEEMFLAQSGMTEMIFTHSDELAVFRGLAEEHACLTVLRADEPFGPKGGEVEDVQAALRAVSMSRTEQVEEIDRWLAGGGLDWREAHAAALEDLLADSPSGPSELRDTLYVRERLPALLHHHNYHKLHFVEMMNPFLHLDVLRFWSALPREHRVGKRLVLDFYREHIGDHREVPIATLDNGADWPGALRRSPELAAWVRERLERLPEPLNRGHFLGKLDAVEQGEEEPPAPPGFHRVPAVKQIGRAVVLGRWLETWAEV